MTDGRRKSDAHHDRRLLEAAQAGDEGAFGWLAERHRGGLEHYCLLMLGCPHQAHAVVYEALLRGWQERRAVAPSSSVRIWLYRLATEVCLENLEATDESAPRPSFDSLHDDD